jgi:hypothetical protein
MTRKSKRLLLVAGFLTVVFFGTGLCGGQISGRKLKSETHLRMILHYGNLTGVGLGIRYSPNRWLGCEFLAGTEIFGTMIYALPYPGTVVNLMLRMQVCHPWGFYASAGGYGGIFDFSTTLEDYLDPLYKFQYGPVLSMGFEFPRKSRGMWVAMEAGMVLNLPRELAYKIPGELEIYHVTVKRSQSEAGSIFPFLLLLFNI